MFLCNKCRKALMLHNEYRNCDRVDCICPKCKVIYAFSRMFVALHFRERIYFDRVGAGHIYMWNRHFDVAVEHEKYLEERKARFHWLPPKRMNGKTTAPIFDLR